MGVQIKLTKSAVDNLAFVQDGQGYYWDTALPGFGLRVGANTKAYFAEARVKGRTIRYTIGRHTVWTAEQARARAKEVLLQMAKGINPNAEKVRERARTITLGEVFQDYLDSRKLKALTVRDYCSVRDGPLKDWLAKPLTAITRDMVSRRHAKLGGTSPARANLAMRVLRAMFNYAIARYRDEKDRPLILTNPVFTLSEAKTWFAVERRQTVIKAHELARWYRAVAALSVKDSGIKRSVVRDYLLLLLFTGLRRGEAAKLKWADVDLVGKTLTVLDTKNGTDHTLPLSDFLETLLCARIASTKDTDVEPYVFPGEGKSGHVVEPRKQMAKVIVDSGVEFTLHDLRRTFTTIAESLDVPAYAIKRLLNHKMKSDVTAGYIVMDVERLRGPIQRITDYILEKAGVRESAQIENVTKEHHKQVKQASA
jgi:integrase